MDVISILFEKIQLWWVNLIEILPNILVGIFILALATLIGKTAHKLVESVLARTHLRPTLRRLIGTTVQFVFIFAGILITLSVLKLDKAATSALAGVGLIGLALGYAFQDIIANFVSGIFISINRVIAVGDYIEADGREGTVIETSLRTTTLESIQGQHIMIPNSKIFEETMINYTTSGERRIDITCGVAYDSDLERVEQVTREVLEQLVTRDTRKDVGFFYTEFGDSSINFSCNFWINSIQVQNFLTAQNEAIKAIKKRFDTEGFDIPFPIRTIINKKN